MSIRFTTDSFPKHGSLKDEAGLPWGCVVQPFASIPQTSSSPSPSTTPPTTTSPATSSLDTEAEDVARCENCYGYISGLCYLEKHMWRCALCDHYSAYPPGGRYKPAERFNLPELSQPVVDLQVASEDSENAGDAIATRLVYVAVVDLSCGEDFLELVKSALVAALEALAPGALFGLVTVARRVGLYNMHHAGAVKYVAVGGSGSRRSGKLSADLAYAIPIDDLLTSVDQYKEAITAALDSLRPATADEGYDERIAAEAQGNGSAASDEEEDGSRAFGPALDGLLKYFTDYPNGPFVGARLLTFLSGPPNHGVGSLHRHRDEDAVAYARRLAKQAAFYEGAAARAVVAGMCVDLFAISPESIHLSCLQSLAASSGGSMLYALSVEDSTLPQDVYRLLSRPRALGGLLRLRTSGEFRVAQAYGHFFADKRYENLHHIISCDPFDTYAYDFEFTTATGFSRYLDCPPTVQMAFQYTVLVPVEAVEDDASNGSTNHHGRWMLQRRLRLLNAQAKVAHKLNNLYDATNADIVLTLLTHKVIAATREEGIQEGKGLLQDWLVFLTAAYCEHYGFAQKGNPAIMNVDVSFSKCARLGPLPRLVFGMLRSPLLSEDVDGLPSDERMHLQFLFTGLEPTWLVRAVYPSLSSYSDPDHLAFPRHSLSRAALTTSNSPIFLLDAYTVLIVYYASTAPPDMPFPPPQQSLLRKTINGIKQERNVTPRLLMMRGGFDNVEPFERYLLEERDDSSGSGSSVGTAAGQGFVLFLDQIARDVRWYLLER
eukprot:jgi/Chlat1/8438/Chrsp80S07919